MKFICLGYADPSQFAAMTEAEMNAAMEECFSYDDVLRHGGHFAGGEALQSTEQTVTLRYRNGKTEATDGPFAETKEQLGGILILEADNMAHAVELMSKHPGVKMGPFEIRPADESIRALLRARNDRVQTDKPHSETTCMFAKPQAEHRWLDQLLGNWSFEHECQTPDGSTSKTPGTMTCRSLGGLWLVCESSGQSDQGGDWSSIMTLGFDQAKNQYVGTFVASMMTNIWPYQGVIDASGKRLPLDSEGPKFDGSGSCKYRDTIEIVDNDNWLFTSELQSDDGIWTQFMVGKHTRL